MASLKMHDFAVSSNHRGYQMNQEAACNVLLVDLCLLTGRLNSGRPSTPLISAPRTPTDGPHEEDQTAAVPDAARG